jgi:hydroxymethylpyrimidine/phosphomethylpyrimidine kinase
VALAAARLDSDRSPTPRHGPRRRRDGRAYTLVTGIPLPEQFVENVLAAPDRAGQRKFELFDATFSARATPVGRPGGAGGQRQSDLAEATSEALQLPGPLPGPGFRPGMGHAFPIACSGPSPRTRQMTTTTNDLDDHFQPLKAL